MNSYTKLKNGAWGMKVFYPGNVQKGDTVKIITKDGKIKSEIISAVIWTGMDKFKNQKVSLCAKAEKINNYHKDNYGDYASGNRVCEMCGQRDCKGGRFCYELHT